MTTPPSPPTEPLATPHSRLAAFEARLRETRSLGQSIFEAYDVSRWSSGTLDRVTVSLCDDLRAVLSTPTGGERDG